MWKTANSSKFSYKAVWAVSAFLIFAGFVVFLVQVGAISSRVARVPRWGGGWYGITVFARDGSPIGLFGMRTLFEAASPTPSGKLLITREHESSVGMGVSVGLRKAGEISGVPGTSYELDYVAVPNVAVWIVTVAPMAVLIIRRWRKLRQVPARGFDAFVEKA